MRAFAAMLIAIPIVSVSIPGHTLIAKNEFVTVSPPPTPSIEIEIIAEDPAQGLEVQELQEGQMVTAVSTSSSTPAPAPVLAPTAKPETAQEAPIKPTPQPVRAGIPDVPFYSQFTDISSAKWQKVGCGITALAMIIEYYHPGTVVVNTLLQEGIDAGAYLNNAGWTYAGLVGVGTAYGLDGTWYDYGTMSEAAAFKKITQSLEMGPVIASVHYEFDPKSTIPHLVVITGIDGDTLYYNDPAAKRGHGTISTEAFLAAWKQRYIVIRPA